MRFQKADLRASFQSVLRIRDVLSRITDPTIAPSRIRGVKKQRIPDPIYFCIKAINKFCLLIPDPGSDHCSIPDSGSGGLKSTGYRIRNTVFRYIFKNVKCPLWRLTTINRLVLTTGRRKRQCGCIPPVVHFKICLFMSMPQQLSKLPLRINFTQAYTDLLGITPAWKTVGKRRGWTGMEPNLKLFILRMR
jgi:hypothetical protein